MRHITITICAALVLAACNNDKATTETKVASATTDEASNKAQAWIPVDSATAEKAMMDYMKPGEAHKLLAKEDGEWTGEMKMWMSPGAPPVTNTGSAVFKMIMDGRYQQGHHKGNFGGMPFEGISTTAYDNAKKVYVSSWIDNMGTGLMTMEGKWDEATKTINYKGKMVCPANGMECDVREVYRIVDDNTRYMEMYGPDLKTGKEYKSMEMTFTRKK
jgi:hypothetical protein